MAQTVVICPACGGTKIDKITALSCTWCNGARTVTPEKAKEHAEAMERIRLSEAMSGRTY